MAITPFPSDKFRGQNFSDRELYKRAWAAFERVLEYNKKVTEDYITNGTPYFNYIYRTYEEKELVIFGQQLHLKAYPEQNWSMDLGTIDIS